ncbi:MrcB family domain-containing protein [Sulfitobacter pontiacus]|uniref:MrcB family domain-containing protein n=1 Tax=Sulfitobacter pontiacus TaxID=60137 RepID=UPI003159D12C
MASEVIEELQASTDPLERDLGAALLKWQDEKASQGLPRSMGYEPRDIRSKGAVAVIETRVLQGSSGFGQIDQNSSYEAIVDRHPERFRNEVVVAARNRLNVSRMENAQTTEFAQLLSHFLKTFGEKRTGSFAVDDELNSAMRNLKAWLEQVPAVLAIPTIKVKLGVGKGKWTKTPWIALLDSRETTSSQRGTYIVFLIAEDLSVMYLTLNQGMTELRKLHGRKGAEEEMVRVAENARTLIGDLADAGFQIDNNIDLRSDASAAKSYEIGTIANVAFLSTALPDDKTVHKYLQNLLTGYERLIQGELEETSKSEDKMPVDLPPTSPYGIDDALEELFLERTDVERYLDIWRSKKNLILQGAPGVGKSFLARRLAYALIGAKDHHKVQAVQFHQSYSYEDFVQGYRPNGSLGFERKNGSFFEFRNRAVADPTGTYVFIIDEINRGNLSKILGELMLLIEPDKRGPEWATRLSYANQGEPDFFVPPNLYILGMMNTADRSLSVVDYALRRRFAFLSMAPLFGSPKYKSHLTNHGVPDDLITKIVSGMGELNQAIEADRINLGPGFRIGHSFFTPSELLNDAETWYKRVVETEIYPLLEEYWFDAPENADQWRDQLL